MAQLPMPGGSSSNSNAALDPNLNNEWVSLLECPVCFEIVLPPIMQCHVGHLVCSNCHPKLSSCPTCRGTLGNIRCLVMEKMAKKLMFPCTYKQMGCCASLELGKKAPHEEDCEFRPYKCPCPGGWCSWVGKLDDIIVHLQHGHKIIRTLDGEEIIFLVTNINMPATINWVVIQHCFGHHFMWVLTKQEKHTGCTKYSIDVQILGTRTLAKCFSYQVAIKKNHRRLVWEAIPKSCQEGIATVLTVSDCLTFDTSTAKYFIDNNGDLAINLTILADDTN